MAKYSVSVMAIGFTIPVIVVLGYLITRAYALSSSAETAALGSIMRIIVPLGVVIYGFIIALNIDKTVASFFGEDSKKKK